MNPREKLLRSTTVEEDWTNANFYWEEGDQMHYTKRIKLHPRPTPHPEKMFKDLHPNSQKLYKDLTQYMHLEHQKNIPTVKKAVVRDENVVRVPRTNPKCWQPHERCFEVPLVDENDDLRAPEIIRIST